MNQPKETWKRSDITICKCKNLKAHTHCPCIICCYKPVHRSTEYRHWRRALGLANSFDSPAQSDNSLYSDESVNEPDYIPEGESMDYADENFVCQSSGEVDHDGEITRDPLSR